MFPITHTDAFSLGTTGSLKVHHGQLEGAGESLVSGRVVVLEGDLQLDGLHEFPLASLDVW